MSIKAMTWAFALPLEPRAKLTLLAIADNANDEGVAWPSRSTISSKSSQSLSTVVRKIKLLEQLGLVLMFERFRPDGSQTSDEIRLNLDVTPADVMRSTHGSEGGGEVDSDDDRPDKNEPEGGCQPDRGGCHADTPGVSLLTPPNEPPLEPRIHSPNPSPGRGGSQIENISEGKDEAEPEHFAGFFESCQHWRTMSRPKALAAFRFLDAAEQGLARAASPLHAAECDKAKRRSLDAHKLIAEQFWTKYPHARLAERRPDGAPPTRRMEGAELEGLKVAVRLAERRELIPSHDAAGEFVASRKTEMQLDLAALAPFAAANRTDREAWQVVELGSPQFAAWRDRLRYWTGVDPAPDRIYLEPHDPAVHGLAPSNPKFKLRKSVEALRVPAPWPPRKDGTWSDDNETSGEQGE